LPKLFVSYSWSSPEYTEEVLRLATVLRSENGVEVILDKWHLKEGDDSYAFMERMVTDPEIQKVVLLCDTIYAEKADTRRGGVGAEAQIVSSELYSKTEQNKFVAVIMERTDEGKFPVPTYYRGRIHIDLSDPTTYATEFDRLLRWVYDKPLHVEPPLGQPPTFLSDEDRPIKLGTSSRYRRAVDTIERDVTAADGAVSEYFDCLVAEMGKLGIEDHSTGEFDDAVVEAIDAFVPYRNEAIRIVDLLAQYRDRDVSWLAVHRFFESLLPTLEFHGAGSFHAWSYDALRFVTHELLLYTVATLLRRERFAFVGHLLGTEYYYEAAADRGRDNMVSYVAFRQSVESLQQRNKRLKLQKLTLWAHMLIERADGHPMRSHDLIQADYVMYIRDQLHQSDEWGGWWPNTLLYAQQRAQPFEVFARARSTAYFNRMRVALGIESREDMQEMVDRFKQPGEGSLTWQHQSVPVLWFLGFDDMCSRP